MTAKMVKIALALAAGVVALSMLAAVIVAWLFDPNEYKDYVAGWVEQQTGREFVIEDDLALSFFPWLAVETGGIRLGNTPEFGPEPFAQIDRAAVRVRVLPLLMRRQVELGVTVLEGVELNLARDAAQNGNWEDLVGPIQEDAAESEPASEVSPFEAIDIAGLRIRDGTVTWRENTSETRYIVSNLAVETSRIALAEQIDIEAELHVFDVAAQQTLALVAHTRVEIDRAGGAAASDLSVEFRLASNDIERAEGRVHTALLNMTPGGSIEIGASVLMVRLTNLPAGPPQIEVGASWSEAAFDSASRALSIEGLSTDLDGIHVTWEIGGASMLEGPEVEGTMAVASAPLAQALNLFSLSSPEGVEPGSLGEFELAAEFQFSQEQLELSSLSAALLGMTVQGDMVLDGGDRIRGRITVPEFRPNASFLAMLQPRLPAGFDARTIDRLAFSARVESDFAGERTSLQDVRANLLGATLTGEVTIEGGARLRGRVDVPDFTPTSGFLALVRLGLPADFDTSALDRVGLSTRFDTDLDTRRASLRDLRANVLGATLTGEVDVIPEANGDIYRGTLKTSRFSPDRFSVAFASLLSEDIEPSQLGMLSLDTQFSYDAGADTLTLNPVAMEVFGLSGSGQLAGRAVSSAAAWTGQVNIQRFSPRDLFKRFGQPIPDTSDATVLTRATIETRFDIDEQGGRFQGIVLDLDDSHITGDFVVDGFEDPGYSFTLAIDGVDVDRYLPPAADAAGVGETTAKDIDLPTEALNTLRLNGSVEVGDLALAGMRFHQVGTRINVGGGSGKLDSARANLYGGTFEGSFEVNARDATPTLALNGRANNLQLRPLIEALMGDANFSGTGSFDLALTGRGATVIENVRSANGSVGFGLADGAIDGFNLGRSLCSAYNVTQKLPRPAQQPDVTRYQVIRGTARVENGTARSSDLLARAAFMDVSGGGALTLAEQRIDYNLEARLTASIGIQGCESMDPLIGDAIPFRIRGSIAEPEITPDFGKLLERRIRDEVRDRATERLQDRLQDLIRSR